VARIGLGERTLLVLSGQVAVDGDGKVVGEDDMAAQTEYVMDTIGTILEAHGAGFGDVVNVRTYLTDMSRLAEYGQARRGRFGDRPPTSTTVEVSRLFVPGALLEVEVTAVV
jgi:enamine deaminase RidA (YjgF/YER057c/UK114 family)